MSLARVTLQEAQASAQEAAEAKSQGKKTYVPVYKEAEIVVVNEAANVYRLSTRTTGPTLRDVAKFMNGIDPKTLPSLTAAKQTMIERAEQFEIERQLFQQWDAFTWLRIWDHNDFPDNRPQQRHGLSLHP